MHPSSQRRPESSPKSWGRRSVPFPTALAEELAALMTGKGRDDLVFTDQRGGVLRNSNWRARAFRPAVTKCRDNDGAFPTVTPHDLRHTALSTPMPTCSTTTIDEVADRLNDAIRVTADGGNSLARCMSPDLLKLCGAKGNRTPDLLDANETRYQLRYSP